MKTVLILTSGKSKQGIDATERFEYVRKFCDAIEDQLSETRVVFTTYNDVEISVVDGNVSCFDIRNQLDFATVNIVHFKNWINDVEIAGTLARFFSMRGATIYNSEVRQTAARTKISQMVLFADSQLPVPDTFFAYKERLTVTLEDASSLPAGLSFPCIMKANDGAMGNDNYLIHDAAEAQEVLKKSPIKQEFVLQAYHPNDGDYRLLYVGLDELPLVFMRRANKKSKLTHLNNTSKGGSGEFVDAAALPSEYLRIAKQAARITGREIGGVDILVDNISRQPYLLEVNQTPALATGFGVDEKIHRFAGLIDSYDDGEEE